MSEQHGFKTNQQIKADLLQAEIDSEALRRKVDSQLKNIEIGVAVLWKVVEHGDAVVGYLTTEQLRWYDEFVLPKLKEWGRL